MVHVGDFVYPGDILDFSEIGDIGKLYNQRIEEQEHKFKPRIGPGLRYDDGKGILITRFGLLKMRGPPPTIKKNNEDNETYNEEQDDLEKSQTDLKLHKLYLWVESPISRYQLPCVGDNVIGTIIKPKATVDSILVDIGCARPAVLPELAFEGATKRNRPEARTGDLVYARLTTADKDIEPELTCKRSVAKGGGLGLGLLTSRVAELFASNNKDGSASAADGSTTIKVASSNKQFTSGFSWETSVDHIIKVLLATTTSVSIETHGDPNRDKTVNLLKLLGSAIPFEIVVGMNGRIWVRSKTPELTLKVYNVLESLKSRSLDECIKLWAPILGEGWTSVTQSKTDRKGSGSTEKSRGVANVQSEERHGDKQKKAKNKKIKNNNS